MIIKHGLCYETFTRGASSRYGYAGSKIKEKFIIIFFPSFICNISLNTISANLTKKAICTWLAYKKTTIIIEKAIAFTMLCQ